MARGNKIIVTADPNGKFDEGTITDTSKPGMFVEVVPGTAMTRGGRPSFRARSLAAGAIGPVAILLEDDLQGFTADTAYVANKPCRVYWPEAGDQLNAVVGDVAGTADDVAIGDKFGINNAGKLIANSSYASAPFQALETKTDPTADYRLWVLFMGPQA